MVGYTSLVNGEQRSRPVRVSITRPAGVGIARIGAPDLSLTSDMVSLTKMVGYTSLVNGEQRSRPVRVSITRPAGVGIARIGAPDVSSTSDTMASVTQIDGNTSLGKGIGRSQPARVSIARIGAGNMLSTAESMVSLHTMEGSTPLVNDLHPVRVSIGRLGSVVKSSTSNGMVSLNKMDESTALGYQKRPSRPPRVSIAQIGALDNSSTSDAMSLRGNIEALSEEGIENKTKRKVSERPNVKDINQLIGMSLNNERDKYDTLNMPLLRSSTPVTYHSSCENICDVTSASLKSLGLSDILCYDTSSSDGEDVSLTNGNVINLINIKSSNNVELANSERICVSRIQATTSQPPLDLPIVHNNFTINNCSSNAFQNLVKPIKVSVAQKKKVDSVGADYLNSENHQMSLLSVARTNSTQHSSSQSSSSDSSMSNGFDLFATLDAEETKTNVINSIKQKKALVQKRLVVNVDRLPNDIIQQVINTPLNAKQGKKTMIMVNNLLDSNDNSNIHTKRSIHVGKETDNQIFPTDTIVDESDCLEVQLSEQTSNDFNQNVNRIQATTSQPPLALPIVYNNFTINNSSNKAFQNLVKPIKVSVAQKKKVDSVGADRLDSEHHQMSLVSVAHTNSTQHRSSQYSSSDSSMSNDFDLFATLGAEETKTNVVNSILQKKALVQKRVVVNVDRLPNDITQQVINTQLNAKQGKKTMIIVDNLLDGNDNFNIHTKQSIHVGKETDNQIVPTDTIIDESGCLEVQLSEQTSNDFNQSVNKRRLMVVNNVPLKKARSSLQYEQPKNDQKTVKKTNDSIGNNIITLKDANYSKAQSLDQSTSDFEENIIRLKPSKNYQVKYAATTLQCDRTDLPSQILTHNIIQNDSLEAQLSEQNPKHFKNQELQPGASGLQCVTKKANEILSNDIQDDRDFLDSLTSKQSSSKFDHNVKKQHPQPIKNGHLKYSKTIINSVENDPNNEIACNNTLNVPDFLEINSSKPDHIIHSKLEKTKKYASNNILNENLSEFDKLKQSETVSQCVGKRSTSKMGTKIKHKRSSQTQSLVKEVCDNLNIKDLVGTHRKSPPLTTQPAVEKTKASKLCHRNDIDEQPTKNKQKVDRSSEHISILRTTGDGRTPNLPQSRKLYNPNDLSYLKETFADNIADQNSSKMSPNTKGDHIILEGSIVEFNTLSHKDQDGLNLSSTLQEKLDSILKVSFENHNSFENDPNLHSTSKKATTKNNIFKTKKSKNRQAKSLGNKRSLIVHNEAAKLKFEDLLKNLSVWNKMVPARKPDNPYSGKSSYKSKHSNTYTEGGKRKRIAQKVKSKSCEYLNQPSELLSQKASANYLKDNNKGFECSEYGQLCKTTLKSEKLRKTTMSNKKQEKIVSKKCKNITEPQLNIDDATSKVNILSNIVLQKPTSSHNDIVSSLISNEDAVEPIPVTTEICQDSLKSLGESILHSDNKVYHALLKIYERDNNTADDDFKRIHLTLKDISERLDTFCSK